MTVENKLANKTALKDKKIFILAMIFLILASFFVIALLFKTVQPLNTAMLRDTSSDNKQMPRIPGPATENIEFKKIKKSEAKDALLKGNIDIFVGAIDSSEAKEFEENKQINLYPSDSTMMGLLLNPYPGSAEELNPFSKQAIRYALQFLIDRDELATDVFSGFANPTVTVPWNKHPSYQLIKEDVEKLNIKYDKQRAISDIKIAMEKAGASLENNVWTYREKPINIIVSHSDWNNAPEIAETLKTTLAEAGFTSTLMSRELDDPEAKSLENYTDASELKWHIAVRGWTYYSQSEILDSAILKPNVEEGWWENKNEKIENLEKNLYSFENRTEREAANSELAKEYLKDSTCIWLLATKSIAAANEKVKGLIQDAYVGISNYSNIREVYIDNKDKITIGLPQVYNEKVGWNHSSFTSLEMIYLLNSVNDPLYWNETKSLKESDFRGSFSMEKQSSAKDIEVPTDAFFWSNENESWKEVAENQKAVTKINYDLSNYLGDYWHHGAKITEADIIYNLARTWGASANTEKRKWLGSYGHESFEKIIGIRLVNQTLEIYLNSNITFLEDFSGIDRVLDRIAPWELYAATDDLVFEQRLYNYHDVGGSDKESLNVGRAEHIDNIFKTLDNISFDDIQELMTLGNKIYAMEEDFDARVAALKKWYAYHNHLYINNGPFYVDSVNKTSGSIKLKAFRDENYPFSRGDWRKR